MAHAIYFCAPVTGGELPREVVGGLIAALKRHGRVLTEHLAAPAAFDAGRTPADIYAADAAWLAEADVLVAEVSQPSTGMGLAIGTLVAGGKRVLALHAAAAKPSTLLRGCPAVTTVPYDSLPDAAAAIDAFFASLDAPGGAATAAAAAAAAGVEATSAGPRYIFLAGPPGVGKGTQAARLAAELGYPAISTGAVLRALVAEGTSAAAGVVKRYMDAGELVPASVMNDIVVARLRAPDVVAAGGAILDGYPPSAADCLNLLRARMVPQVGGRPTVVAGVAIAGKGGRAARVTGTADVAAKRVDVYKTQAGDLASGFPAGLVVDVDATGSIDAVYAATVAAVASPRPLPPSSYYLTPRRAGTPEKSARYHAHLDACSHAAVRWLLAEAELGVRTSPAKLYPITHLALGPQASSAWYAGMPNFRPIAGADNEGFATIRFGDAGIDVPQLVATLEVAAAHARTLAPMVEVEENLYEADVDYDTGALTVAFNYAVERIDDVGADLPAAWSHSPARKRTLPEWELHHGFDVPRSAADGGAPVIPLDTLVAATAAAGLEVGGWFIFGKAGVWAYRCNHFRNGHLPDARAALVAQAEALRIVLHTLLPPGVRPTELNCSMERMVAMWCF